MVTGIETRHLGYLTMTDGVELAYVAYVPESGNPVPAILTMDAYGISGIQLATAEQAALSPTRLMESGLDPQCAHIRHFLGAGYAFVGVNVRGSGASTGQFEWLNPLDGKDGAQVIEWIAEQAWCDGNVGMYGASHQAITQIAVASEGPPHLKAIAPASGVLDSYRDVFCIGGLPNVAFAHKWFNVYQPMLADMGVEERLKMGDERAGSGQTNPPPPIVAQLTEHPDRDAWWERLSLETRANSITVPALVIHAWQDPAVPVASGVRLFQALRGPKRFVGVNGGHEICIDMFDELLAWFDRWLRPLHKGEDSGDDATVSLWMEAVPDDDGWVKPNWTIELDEWPSNAGAMTYSLTSDGRLASSSEDVPPDTRSYLYPIGSQRLDDDAAFSAAPDPAGSLTYRTEPLAADSCLVGSAALTLHVTSELNDAHFLVALHDVDPDGRVQFVQQGLLRGSAPTTDATGLDQTSVEHDFSRRVNLGDGEVHEIQIALFPVAHLFRKGHLVELVIMSPGVVPGPQWGFAPFARSGMHTVHHGGATRSTLTFPTHSPIPPRPDRPDLRLFRSQPSRVG